MVFVGDFLQLPPVHKAAGPVSFAFESRVWLECRPVVVEFLQYFRQARDPEYAKVLEDVRMGIYSDSVERILRPRLNAELPVRDGIGPTVLFSRVADVDAYNERGLSMLDTTEFRRFRAVDINSDEVDLDAETMLPELLTLKVGAQVLAVATPQADTPARFCNGDIGIVVRFVETPGNEQAPWSPVVSFVGKDEIVVVPTTMEVRGRTGVAQRTQIPLKLAYAATVHRFQGTTLPQAEVALDQSFFEYGQAYVALSRVGSAAHLRLTALVPEVIRAPPAAVKFYRELADIRERMQRIRGRRE